ncbi:MAG: hypothetical protein K6G90_01370 [Clostridia bacterium]|nr:hypothetical protein [Clostridia bacterium]
MKKLTVIISLILALLLSLTLASCDTDPAAEAPSGSVAQTEDAANEIYLPDKLAALMTTDEGIGLKGKYAALEDIADGTIDKDLVGTWKTADGETTYTYNEDGTSVATSEFGDNESRFTCIKTDAYRVICQEARMTSEDADGNATESTVLSYSTYEVDNDALFMTVVEDTTDEFVDSSYTSLVVMYRADETGSTEESMAKNKIDIDTFTGTWASEKGEFTVAEGKLTLGEDVFDVSVNETGKLVVASGDAATEYSFNLVLRKQYEDKDRTNAAETMSLGLYYTGADENDKPNLISVLDDWKTDYQWESWYYTGTFDLQ